LWEKEEKVARFRKGSLGRKADGWIGVQPGVAFHNTEQRKGDGIRTEAGPERRNKGFRGSHSEG